MNTPNSSITPDLEGVAPTAALLVIGNEILSGRTRDINIHACATRLTAIGCRQCVAGPLHLCLYDGRHRADP
jgi:hypothetical protein